MVKILNVVLMVAPRNRFGSSLEGLEVRIHVIADLWPNGAARWSDEIRNGRRTVPFWKSGMYMYRYLGKGVFP